MTQNFAKPFAAVAIAAALLVVPQLASARPYAPPPAYGYQGGWDQPPSEFREIQRQGFRDGIAAARGDFDAHHPPNIPSHEEFRHPPVPLPSHADYRVGFRHGYTVAMNHFVNQSHGR